MGTITGKILFAGQHATKTFLRRYTGYVEQFGRSSQPNGSQSLQVGMHVLYPWYGLLQEGMVAARCFCHAWWAHPVSEDTFAHTHRHKPVAAPVCQYI